MTDPSKDSHWQELVTDLGAQPQSDAGQPPAVEESKSIADTPPEFDTVRSQAAMTPPPAPGWDQLASDFGIRDASAPAGKAPPAKEPVTPEAEKDIRERPAVAPSDRPAAAGRKRRGDRAEQPSRGDRAARGRDRGRRQQLADDSSASQAENFSVDVEHIDLAVDFQPEEPAEDVDQLIAVEGEGAERKEAEEKSERPRRRRRRRGRRGARRTDEQEADQDSSVAEAQEGREDELDEDELAEEEEEFEGDSADASQSGRTKHRNIPTWDEAVGVVIAANKEARARAAKSTGRGRSRRGRGRPSRTSQDQAK